MKQLILELIRQKRRMLLVIAGLLLLNIGLYAVNSRYLTAAVAAAQLSWNDLRQRVAVAGRTDVATIYRRGQDDLKKLALRIPAKRQFPQVLGEILDAAVTSGVMTTAVSYKPQLVKEENLLAFGISFSGHGSYAAVKSFLSDLQKAEELIVVENVSLSNTDLYEENVVMDLHLTVYLKAEAGS